MATGLGFATGPRLRYKIYRLRMCDFEIAPIDKSDKSAKFDIEWPRVFTIASRA